MINKFRNFKSKLGWWFWVLLVVAIVVVWRVVANSNKTTKVQTTKVTQGDIVESVSTSGTVNADQYVSLTFPAGGMVTYVNVKPGDKVTRGQAIAGIDTVALNATYQNAVNTYRATQAAVALEHDNDKNYGAGETYSQASTRTAAEVANDNAYNNMLAAQENLKNANIYAPFSGVMDTVSPTSPGVNLVAATANYTIVNPSTVYFNSQVEETDLPNVKVGQKADIVFDAYPNKTYEGVVTNIGLVAFTSDTGGNAYHVRVSLPDNSDLKFRVGMQGDVNIIYNTVSDVSKVNSSALVSEGNNNYVWKIEGGKIKKVKIEVGQGSADETQILSGINVGDMIVDQPSGNLKDGQKVSY